MLSSFCYFITNVLSFIMWRINNFIINLIKLYNSGIVNFVWIDNTSTSKQPNLYYLLQKKNHTLFQCANYNAIHQSVTSIRMAYVPPTEMENIIKICLISHSSFNKILSSYPFRMIPIIDPHRLNSNFSVSKPLLSDYTSINFVSTEEYGEFANIFIENHMIQSFWLKSSMHYILF